MESLPEHNLMQLREEFTATFFVSLGSETGEENTP